MRTREMVYQTYVNEIQRQNKFKEDMDMKKDKINEQMAQTIKDKMAKKEEPEKKKSHSRPKPPL